MKRRTFLTAASAIGAVTVASSATVVSSVYNNLSLSVLLEEFDTTSKNVLDKFVTDIAENAESLGLDSKFAKRIAMPVQILEINTKKNNQTITYKNKTGQNVLLSVENGEGKVMILDVV